MKAIIFSAGLGTRLKPLTDHCPKALVQLNGKPLLWHAINKLVDSGATSVVVNVHHFGAQIIEYLQEQQFRVPILISDERNELLDTGGGLLKARHLLDGDEPVVACNVDVLSAIDLNKLIGYHHEKAALATLVVRKRETQRYLMFDNNMELTGWKNVKTGEEKIANNRFHHSSPWAFSGIQVLSPGVFRYITETGKFSLIPMYLRLAEHHHIAGYPDHSAYWFDVGSVARLKEAEAYFQKK